LCGHVLGGNFNESKYVVPGFLVWDALVGCDTKIVGRKIQFRLKVKNVTNKIYRDAGVFANPRTWMFSASTRF
jgi:outer membrane receptor protein involved in Fe transport